MVGARPWIVVRTVLPGCASPVWLAGSEDLVEWQWNWGVVCMGLWVVGMKVGKIASASVRLL